MSIFSAFISAMLTVLLICPIAWLILSSWLGGRSLIIAAIASAVSAGIGRYSYTGPANGEALIALAGVVGALFAGALIARVWLTRAAKNSELIDG